MRLNSTMQIPFKAFNYKDNYSPFVFVSYAHKDRNEVYPIINQLHKRGIPIWYDEGIEPADEWLETIADALSHCRVFLVFISNNSIKRNNVKREVHQAMKRYDKDEVKIVPVYLEDTVLPKGLSIVLDPIQAFLNCDIEDLIERLQNIQNPDISRKRLIEKAEEYMKQQKWNKAENTWKEIGNLTSELMLSENSDEIEKKIALCKEKRTLNQRKGKRKKHTRYLKGKDIKPLDDPGEYLVTLHVVNKGEVVIENFVLIDRIPDNFEYFIISDAPDIIDIQGVDTLKWTIPSIPPESRCEIQYILKGEGNISDEQESY
ncbi:MAG: TIR domain-containing protein [Candidatus Lokiarchaeota archaeon]|nr:TIR domain-containing protein [Candidatus Lokiarchaeota archaeon]